MSSMSLTTRMPALTPADCELIAAYAALSREYYPGLAWSEAEARLAAGWPRVRGQCALDWLQVAAMVRAIWNAPRAAARPRAPRD